jgi:hypothetical protein
MLGRKLGLGNESVSGIYIDDWYAAKSVVLSHLYITAIVLPRQARDKHIGKPLKKDFCFLRWSPGGPSEVEGLEAVRDKQNNFLSLLFGSFSCSSVPSLSWQIILLHHQKTPKQGRKRRFWVRCACRVSASQKALR